MEYQLSTPSSPQWLETVMADFDSFLKDHASCEKKASGMALSIISHYPDKPELIRDMLNLSMEELSHYREVMRLLLDRGITPGPDEKDHYIRALHALMDQGHEVYLMDRLIIGSIVEARGAERFGLIADGLEDPALKRFYRAITDSESRHYIRFIELACQYFPTARIKTRLAQLLEQEAAIIDSLPLRPRLH